MKATPLSLAIRAEAPTADNVGDFKATLSASVELAQNLKMVLTRQQRALFKARKAENNALPPVDHKGDIELIFIKRYVADCLDDIAITRARIEANEA